METDYEFKIESGFEIPTGPANADPFLSRMPLGEMKPGDSIFVPKSFVPDKTALHKLRNFIKNRRDRLRVTTPGINFTTRLTQSGLRIWRTK